MGMGNPTDPLAVANALAAAELKVAAEDARGAPARIEITDGMVNAGVWAFEQFTESGLTSDVVVREVFEAMVRARRPDREMESRAKVGSDIRQRRTRPISS
jgi:hypothetical protein